MTKKISVLFVCMANICRSPALEGALRHIAAQEKKTFELHVDSCGMGWFHLGQNPDRRVFEAAKKRGVLLDHKAQQFHESFFSEFDYIFAVDEDIVEQVKYHAKNDLEKSKVKLATEYSSKYLKKSIPDPYYMSSDGFEEMMDIVEDSARGIFHFLKKNSP